MTNGNSETSIQVSSLSTRSFPAKFKSPSRVWRRERHWQWQSHHGFLQRIHLTSCLCQAHSSHSPVWGWDDFWSFYEQEEKKNAFYAWWGRGCPDRRHPAPWKQKWSRRQPRTMTQKLMRRTVGKKVLLIIYMIWTYLTKNKKKNKEDIWNSWSWRICEGS